MDIVIEGVTARNFLSIGQVTQGVRLDDAGLTLVLGENMDSEFANSRNGVGKAQPLDAKVLTPNGWVRMGEIRVGDIVTTPDGAAATVGGVYPQGMREVYRVTFADGRSTECCQEHLWRVWCKTGGWGWRTMPLAEIAERLGKGLHCRFYVPLATPPEGVDKDLPIEPRMLGILLGDGGFSKKTGIKLSSHDDEIVDWVRLCLPYEYHCKEVAAGSRDYAICLRDTREPGDYAPSCKASHFLAVPLRELGLMGRRSEEKFIPDVYKSASSEQRIALLSGLMDTDGYVCRHGTLSYTTVSERLAADVQELVRSLGGIAAISTKVPTYTYRGEKRTGRLAYTVRIRYPRPRDLVALSRKRDRIRVDYQYADTLRLEIKSIELVGQKPTQCIMVNHPDHLYVTDDWIVTHNTSLVQAVFYALYGVPLTKIKLDNLVNSSNSRGMLVTLDFRRGSNRYRIERGRKPNILKFTVNDQTKGSEGEKDETEGENRHTQAEIERVVGMTPMMFKVLIALNTYTEPFLRLTAADQRALIEELLGVTVLSERSEGLKVRIASTKEAIKIEEHGIQVALSGNERIDGQITRAELDSAAWRADHDGRLASIRAEMATLGAVDFEAAEAAFAAAEEWDRAITEVRQQITASETTIASVTREAARLRSDIARRQAPDRSHETLVRRLEAERAQALAAAQAQGRPASATRLLAEAERREREAERHYAKALAAAEKAMALDAEIENPDAHNCHACGQALTGTDHLAEVMATLTAQRNNLLSEAEAEDHAADVARHQAAAAKFEAVEAEHRAETDKAAHIARAESIAREIAEAVEQDRQARASVRSEAELLEKEAAAIEDAVVAEQAQLEVLQGRLVTLNGRPKTAFTDRRALSDARRNAEALGRSLAAEEAREDPHASKIDSLRSTLSVVDYARLNDLQSLLKHEDFLLKLLTGKDSYVRKRIVDRSLGHLNRSLNTYLTALGLPHEVAFRPDLTVEISLLGRDYDYAQLSRGEQNRVSLAISFAFRDLWEQTNHPINLLIADEVLDSGLDEAGGEAALTLLRKMALDRHRSVILISHKEGLVGRVGRVLMVRREQGFTRFEMDSAA